ncbi:hypothetical protein QYE76_048520 [Lolium multiflorum]|uniref:KIB1-4 beta-propeller domain-containing protein n=1 Tax=Lolium multiflorum TaxID=4521 RepID=A0AAD8SL20_LOLMU|nr:hypothetical protein QYE76_048520 [Lolium multiflorum]
MDYSRLCRGGGDGHLEALTGDNIDLIAAHLDVTYTVRLAACSRELYDMISKDEGKMHHWDEPCLLMPPPAYWFDEHWDVARASRLHDTVYDLVPLDHPRRSVALPFMHDRKWLGANGDWIAAADHHEWCLVNVYTERHIPLPSLPDSKIHHSIVSYRPAYSFNWRPEIYLLKIVICQVPTKGGRYADYKLIALFDKTIFYLEGGGDWRMLEALTPAPDYPNYCDAIELRGHVFAVDETDGSTYFWDTANGIFSGYSRLCGAESTREKRALRRAGIRRGNSLPEGEIDAIAIVIELDIISIIIIIVSTIYTAITTAAPRHRCISMNEVRKKLFTISLSGKAAHWYKLLKNGDSIDWEDIVPLFYSKFYPPNKTLLDTSCSGSFTRKNEEFKRDLLDRIQENTEGWENDKDRESVVANLYKAFASHYELPKKNFDKYHEPYKDKIDSSVNKCVVIETVDNVIPEAYIEKTPFPAKMKEYSVISSAVNKSEKKPKEPEEQIKIEPAVAIVKDLVTENVEDGHIIFCEDASNIVSHPNKPKQVSVPMLSVRIGDHCYYGLCDIGASVSAIPYELYTEIMHEIGSCELEDIDVVIHLANRETISPIGIVRDVEVLCGKIKYPADFLVLGSAASDYCPIIFGRPFLNTCGAIIDCKKEKILTRFAGEPYEFNFSKFTKTPYKVDLPSNDFKMEQCASIVLVPNNPLQQHLENSESEAFRKERDELEEIFLRQPILKHDLPVEDLGTTPPPKEDPVFDLKPLPDNLKYAHIDDKKIYPVIISSKLSEIEEERICFGSRSIMSSSGTQKDSFFEDVVNPYMNELKMHPKELQLVDGELQIKDVQGPKGEGSLEDRMEKLEQEVFNYKKMAEREVDIFHKIVSELIDGHKKETAKLWDDIFSLHDTTNKLQAQLYDVHNQNCEYENRFKRISHAASFRFPETKMSFVDGGPLPWKSDDDKDSPSSPKE